MAQKLLLLCIVLLGLLAIAQAIEAPRDVDESIEGFKQFVMKYEKKYTGLEEFNRRFNIYQENCYKIKKMREEALKRQSLSVPGVTKFADMTEEEFRSTVLMTKGLGGIPCNVGNEKKKMEPLSEEIVGGIPDSWDWRDHGAVTSVKDQGTVGTCWAFSSVGNIEGQWFLAGNELVSLSEEQVSDCDSYDCGVFGGWPCRAYQYVLKTGGLMTDAEYPYCVGTGACYPCMAKGFNETFCGPGPTYCNETAYPCRAVPGTKYTATINDWKYYSDDETQLAAYLYQNGPISVAINAAGGIPSLQWHEYGIWDPVECSNGFSDLDHAVLIVGYGVDGDTPYWIVKNSWGTDWAYDGGYFKMLRGKNLCGVAIAATTSIITK